MTLEVYRLAIETLRLLRPLIAKIARHDPDLARQLKKAGASVALNIAEGSGASGGSARNHFCIARGSARESIACLEVASSYRRLRPGKGRSPGLAPLRGSAGAKRPLRP